MFLITLLFKNGIRQIVISGYWTKNTWVQTKKQDRYRCECVCVFLRIFIVIATYFHIWCNQILHSGPGNISSGGTLRIL